MTDLRMMLAKNRQAKEDAVESDLHGFRSLPGIEEGIDRAADTAKQRPPVLDNEIRHADHDERWRRQVGTKTLEDFLECRNHEDHDHCGNDEGDNDDRHRIKQRRLDLGSDGDHFLLVVGQAIQEGFQNAGLFAGRHQVAVQGVKLQWILPERLRKRTAGLDIGLDIQQQLAYGRVVVPATDDFEGLQQRHASFHHRRQLARKQRDILVGDLPPTLEALSWKSC
jgi:hypothetical protein